MARRMNSLDEELVGRATMLLNNLIYYQPQLLHLLVRLHLVPIALGLLSDPERPSADAHQVLRLVYALSADEEASALIAAHPQARAILLSLVVTLSGRSRVPCASLLAVQGDVLTRGRVACGVWRVADEPAADACDIMRNVWGDQQVAWCQGGRRAGGHEAAAGEAAAAAKAQEERAGGGSGALGEGALDEADVLQGCVLFCSWRSMRSPLGEGGAEAAETAGDGEQRAVEAAEVLERLLLLLDWQLRTQGRGLEDLGDDCGEGGAEEEENLFDNSVCWLMHAGAVG